MLIGMGSSYGQALRALAVVLVAMAVPSNAFLAPSRLPSGVSRVSGGVGSGGEQRQGGVAKALHNEQDTAQATQQPAVQARSGVDKVNEASKKMGGPLSGITDSLSGVAFTALHLFDDCGVQEAAKNLRVLWTRALLASSGEMQDPIAYELLPPSTRFVVSEAAAPIWKPLLPFCEWIKARTEYLDSFLDAFLAARLEEERSSGNTDAPEWQVVVMGAGYDTRSIRKQHPSLRFFEVDLPEVCEGKSRLFERYANSQSEAVKRPTMVPMDLEVAGNSGTLFETLYKAGLREDTPTLVLFEAVLFYLEPPAVQGIFQDVVSHSQTAETVVSFTDSLKGLGITKPFMPDVKEFFEENSLELITHRAQWGGAVHFTSAASTREYPYASSRPSLAEASSEAEEDEDNDEDDRSSGPGNRMQGHMRESFGKPVNSYAPQYTANTAKLLTKQPSFRNTWYAVALSSEVSQDGKDAKPYATRLWGEPVVLFRDKQGELVCLRDVCPHRAAPLSMGELSDGSLKCFYHGWEFGKDGECLSVPTIPVWDSLRQEMQEDKENPQQKGLASLCAKHYAVVEKDDLIWIWGGEVLEADPSLIQTYRPGEKTLSVDTVLDYNVDWKFVVENNLDSPHIYWLHDGSIPPLASLGFTRDKVDSFSLRRFTDDFGVGHVGKTSGKTTTKVVRFDAPNIVRHCGVSGFSEEFHIVPIAPNRCRVLLRQHFPKGPTLSLVERDPFLLPSFTLLMKFWNYIIALEDYSVMQGQSHNIEDLGAAHVTRAGLGDDLISQFYQWRRRAVEAEGEPYFRQWSTDQVMSTADDRTFGQSADSAGSYAVRSDDPSEGTWGVKRSYQQQAPAATNPPVNAKGMRRILELQKFSQEVFEGKRSASLAMSLACAYIIFSTSILNSPAEALNGIFNSLWM